MKQFAGFVKYFLALTIIMMFAPGARGDDLKRPNPARYKKAIAKFAKADEATPPPKNPILFVGSSSIRMWKLPTYFPNRPVLNRGFGGSVINDSIHYFDQLIKPYNPKALVFYAGDNDIAAKLTPTQVRDDFLRFVKKFRDAYPETPMIYISIKPCKKRWGMVENVRKANALIKAEIQKKDRVYFLDIDAPLIGADGLPMDNLFIQDKLHLSHEGYLLWTKLLTPYLILAERGEALGHFAGRVDLGAGVNCMLFAQKGGGWMAAAWADKPTKLPKILAQTPATDVAGKSVSPTRLTAAPLFFAMKAIPQAWDEQRQCEALSPTILTVFPGGTVKFQIKSAAPVKLTGGFQKSDVTELNIKVEDKTFVISAEPEAKRRAYKAMLSAEGKGWIKDWPVTIYVKPEVAMTAGNYLPGKPAQMALISNSGRKIKVKLSVPPGAGTLSETELTVGKTPGKISFTPEKGMFWPTILTATTAQGARYNAVIYPGFRDIPKAENITLDGKLADWPARAEISGQNLPSSAPMKDQLYLAWSEKGLYLAGRIYFPDKKAVINPRKFWTWTAVELFLDTDSANKNSKAKSVAQYWLSPVKDDGGQWRAYAGEWKRSPKLEKTIFDDSRIKTAISVEKDELVMEAMIPAKALGAVPAAGKTWRGAITAQQCAVGKLAILIGWPNHSGAAINRNHQSWGQLRFVEKAEK